MKRSLTLSVARDCKLKPPMRYRFKSTRVTVIEVTDSNASVGKQRNWNPHTWLVGMQTQNAVAISQKVTHSLIMGLSNSTPRNLPERTKARVHMKTRTQMFMAASFITSQSGNDLRVHHQLVNG